jgi:uncharacterized membrane protein YeaQ/YmgE (transglycosylase-associated protein family)
MSSVLKPITGFVSRSVLAAALAATLCLGAVWLPLCPASAQGLGERLETTAGETKQKLQEAGESAVNKIEAMWRQIDSKRLKNRKPDEIVAWIIMGMLVGSLGGFLSIFRTSSVQRMSDLIIGLIGAFVGGIIASLSQLNLGLGPVLIRYEDLLFSLTGGILLMLGVRFYRARKRKEV